MIFGGSFLSRPEGISDQIMNVLTAKVTKAVTFNTDPGVFLYLPAFVLKRLTSGVFLHFHWSDALNLICEPAGSISKFGKHEVLQRLISSPLTAAQPNISSDSTVRRRLHQTWQKKVTEPQSRVLPNAAYRTTGVVVKSFLKGWIIQHQQPWEQMMTRS